MRKQLGYDYTPQLTVSLATTQPQLIVSLSAT